jgi:hypothetical protein
MTDALPLFCHEEFLEQLGTNRATSVGKRASLLLHRLLLNERREFFKPTQGVNKGWRRSRLGGTSGSHFYAWWAPRGAPPLANGGGFDAAPEGAIFVRAIRHHDDHTPLDPQTYQQAYVPLSAADMRDEALVPPPWTTQQNKFANARQIVRTLRGFPGSGKTTALWRAAEVAVRKAVLYVTYSRDLALLAEDYFAKLGPGDVKIRVITFPELLRLCAGAQETPEPARAARARFVKEVSALSPRLLGAWADAKGALYDELHAHLIGSALPQAIGRWPASTGRRMGGKDYRALRDRHIGRGAADSAMDCVVTLDKRIGKPIEDLFFPELTAAAKGLERLRENPHSGWLNNAGLTGYDCIALDEAQDLTPLESMMLIELARRNGSEPMTRLTFLAAGDEAQTVRPSDFEWGWFHDLLHTKLGTPADFELRANLRSPQRIAEVINRVWDLYGVISRQARPSGSSKAELDDEGGDQVVFCTAQPGEELNELLDTFATREGLALINLSEQMPAWLPEKARTHVVSAAEVKGLDFHSVCILNGGEFLQRITGSDRDPRPSASVNVLTTRLAIDQLRVAVSRPAERLYWLDVAPTGSSLGAARELLSERMAEPAMPVAPSVVLKSLEEETLSVPERVRLCEADARQFLAVKPDIAWSRASQALSLLGPAGAGEADVALRRSAHLTMAEIAFCLALRGVKLSAHMGASNVKETAFHHATLAGGDGLRNRMITVSNLSSKDGLTDHEALDQLSYLARTGELEPWIRLEFQPLVEYWARRFEGMALRPQTALGLAESIEGFYKQFAFADAAERTRKVRIEAIETLLGVGLAASALKILEMVPDVDPALRARAVMGTGKFAEAADMFSALGDLERALVCYRSIPDFEKALEIANRMETLPAAESLLWLDKMRKLAAERPANFNKIVLPAEKKLLEEVLESALGATRRKPAVKKTPSAKATGMKAPAPKTALAKAKAK